MGPPQFPEFNTSVPHIRANPFQPPKSLSSTPKTPQFNTSPSVPLQKSLTSTHPPQFNNKNPSVPLQKSLSSTPKTPQFNTKNPSVPHQKNT